LKILVAFHDVYNFQDATLNVDGSPFERTAHSKELKRRGMKYHIGCHLQPSNPPPLHLGITLQTVYTLRKRKWKEFKGTFHSHDVLQTRLLLERVHTMIHNDYTNRIAHFIAYFKSHHKVGLENLGEN
jgi:hypothetical protein